VGILAAVRSPTAVFVIAMAAKPAPLSDEEQAIRILRLSHLTYTWAPGPRISADLSGDGVVEVAIPGVSGKQVAVGIIRGPVAPLAKMFVLSWAAELVGGPACLSRLKLETEDPRLPPDLWGCAAGDQSYFCRDNRELAAHLATAATQGARGLVLRAEGCYPVHAFWDTRTEQMGWWRELPPREAPPPVP
jgi:hypothetical protein